MTVGLEDAHDIKADLRWLSLPDDYADEAMSIHTLEHIYLWEVPATLLEWKRVLKPGGRLIVEMPDLFKCCRNIAKGDRDPRRGLWGIYGDSSHEDVLMLHKHGQTPETLTELLKDAGFIKIVEKPTEFHGKRHWRDMRIECRKP